MNKEKEHRKGQIVRGGRVVGFWFLTKEGELFIGSENDMRKVEPEEKINFQSLKGFPKEKILVYNTEVSPSNESKTPDDS